MLRPGRLAMGSFCGLGLVLAAGALTTVPADAKPSSASGGTGVNAAALAVHRSLLTLDTHLDTPASLVIPGWSIMVRHDPRTDYTQVDLPRMKQGNLGGGFWAVYTPQGALDPETTRAARDSAFMRAVAIREMVAAHPASFALADKAADAARIAASGRRVVYLSIENAWPLGDDITLLRTYYRLGVRMSGFAHFRNNQFADSATDKEKWGGLSPAGKGLLAEMNRLGVVADLSHSSDKALEDALTLSKAPIILSHSGCRAVFDHPRNIDDAHLRVLAAKGGVIQINSVYVKASAPNPAREAAMKALEEKYPESRNLSPAERAAYLADRREIDRRYPETGRATFDDVMANLLHAIKVAGVDHVGIGADWDGGGGATGFEDVTYLPRITAALLKAGYTREDIAKIWSGNVLRVLAAAEEEAAREARAG
ncbi:membrane dipeptidase [Novosphingobium nitrogenifigens DSM 19370]|uniref:Membrane dipeptidase n=1 Tax=Novosphingobium nitrogenifigens DSM 19370 TaxID=983920 RepID=F1ZAE6_9SPHN|nr:dipeptidase [Novosphingobium nitrogenifigens]EGD58446.1 membrane dipeptidase [Novosphingobium nitrogenifigens DSM 19370]